MASKYWIRNDEGELIEFNPYSIPTGKGAHQINMRTTWSGTTKIEFSETTMDESIKRMNK